MLFDQKMVIKPHRFIELEVLDKYIDKVKLLGSKLKEITNGITNSVQLLKQKFFPGASAKADRKQAMRRKKEQAKKRKRRQECSIRKSVNRISTNLVGEDILDKKCTQLFSINSIKKLDHVLLSSKKDIKPLQFMDDNNHFSPKLKVQA